MAQVLVMVMLLASGRLLACGWQCSDELASPAASPCHQESAPLTTINGEVAHACLPEAVEPRVTAVKPAAPLMASAPMLATAVSTLPTAASRADSRRTAHALPAPPCSPAPSVLRI